MNSALLSILLQNLIPLITVAIRAHANATGGTLPTDAQVLAALAFDTDAAIKRGEEWLALHPAPPTNVTT